MCVVAAAVGGGLAAGIGSGAIGSLLGGGGGGGSTNSNGSLGQGVGDILSGGLSAALGIQGLAGGNANQLQAGAAAANPFGQYSAGFVPLLEQLLGGGNNPGSILANVGGNQASEQALIQQLMGSAGINTGAQNIGTNISTPSQQSTLQGLINNPTQLIQALQGGGVQTPGGITALANSNPFALTQGQQFQEQQGLDALNRSLASTGQIGSGNQMVAAEQYGQNFASQAEQQNVTNMLGAQSSINQTAGTNQGLQGILNSMGQNQFGNAATLMQLLTGQQQSSFGNAMSQSSLLSQQQQNTQTNLQNLLSMLTGINSTGTSSMMSLLAPLLTATQASSSSPATAGGILSNLGVANQTSGGNIASGLGGLANGLGQLMNAGSFSGFGATGSENPGASATSTPDDLIAGYTGSF